MKKKILLFPGSFKPPHYGHFLVVEKLLKDFDEIYIIISNKPRPLDKKYKNFKNKSIKEMNKILKTNFESKEDAIKKYEKLIKDKKIGVITGEMSKLIWEIYITYLNTTKIKLILSKAPSPVMVAMAIYQKNKKKDNITMIKSDKNINNKRFKNCNKDCHKLIIGSFHDLNSTNAREEIYLNKKSKFYKFLPPVLNNSDKNKIWNIVNIFKS